MSKAKLLRNLSVGVLIIFGLTDCKSNDAAVEPPIELQGLTFSKENIINKKTAITYGGVNLEQVLPTKCGFKAFKVSYDTTDAAGKPTVATGVITVPIEESAGAIVSYQHGTSTLRTDVPSNIEESSEALKVGLIFGGSCFAIVATDYLGLGDNPGSHPYLNAATEATAAADLIKKAKVVLQKLGYQWNQQLFLAGYSQGGHSTMALHRYLQNTEHMDVTASAPMAGPYDLSGTTIKVLVNFAGPKTNLYAGYLVMSLHSTYGLYPDLSEAVLSPYAQSLPKLYSGLYSSSEIQNKLPETLDLLMTPHFIESAQNASDANLMAALQDNDVYQWVPTAPMRLMHASGDREVPFLNSRIAQKYMADQGADVTIVDLGNLGHGTAFIPALLSAENWFASFAD